MKKCFVVLMLLPFWAVCATRTPAQGPNYIGFFDVGDCNQIAGWAADMNRPNTPINVTVVFQSTFTKTVLAKASRADSAAIGTAVGGGDSGLHAFSIPTPNVLKDGQPHSITIRFESTTIELGNSPRSITCQSPAVFDVSFKLNAGAASTKERLLSPTFTVIERNGPITALNPTTITHYRILESPDTHVVDISGQPWIPLDTPCVLATRKCAGHIPEFPLNLRNGSGQRYGERRVLFQLKTATVTLGAVSDTIVLEPAGLKEYRVSASGNTHPLIQYAASQGFGFPLNYYETCKGDCVNSSLADADLSSGSAAVAVQGLSQGGSAGRHDANPVVCVLVSVVTLGLASPFVCNTPDSAAGPAGTCTTKADYLLFTGRSPNQFWRIKSADVSNAYVVSHGANRFLAKFSFANKGATCLPPSLISVGDVIVEGPEVDDFVDAANPWKNAFVRRP